MSIEAEQTIKSGQMQKGNSKLLKVLPTTSMHIAEKKLMDLKGNFVEYERAAYRADMYSFNFSNCLKDNLSKS